MNMKKEPIDNQYLNINTCTHQGTKQLNKDTYFMADDIQSRKISHLYNINNNKDSTAGNGNYSPKSGYTL